MANIAHYPRLSGDWLRHELDSRLNREQVTIATGTGDLRTGSVLAKVAVGAASTVAKSGGNTGDGTMGAVTVGPSAQVGLYTLRFFEAAADGGQFQVVDPEGDVVGIGRVGAAFSGGGLAFTVADGPADFIVGDGFDITVAAGSGKWGWYNPTLTNGAQVPGGILLHGVDASGGTDVQGVVVTGEAEIVALNLDWHSSVDDQSKKNAGLKLLAAKGFRTRQLA